MHKPHKLQIGLEIDLFCKIEYFKYIALIKLSYDVPLLVSSGFIYIYIYIYTHIKAR